MGLSKGASQSSLDDVALGRYSLEDLTAAPSSRRRSAMRGRFGSLFYLSQARLPHIPLIPPRILYQIIHL